jgi:hypothetical protein
VAGQRIRRTAKFDGSRKRRIAESTAKRSRVLRVITGSGPGSIGGSRIPDHRAAKRNQTSSTRIDGK